MQTKKTIIPLLAFGLILVLGSSIWLATAKPVNAQCGSQASSCKNCHEVQGEDPVNNDGTGWHQSHAFGDFCYICHAGNSQATVKEEAHSGMVAPLSDIDASCLQCHPNDLNERAQVYASALGVEVGSGGSAAPPAEPAGDNNTAVAASSDSTNTQPAAEVFAAPAASSLVVDDPNVVDYVKRYNEVVLGQRDINKGNLVLSILIVIVALGGGAFVIYNEGWLQNAFKAPVAAPESLPPDVKALVDDIARLDPEGRDALLKLLEKPRDANQLLHILAHFGRG